MKKQKRQAEKHCTTGYSLQMKGQLDEAINHYQTALRIDPSCAEAYFNLGLIFHDRGQLDDAITYYQKHSQLNPNDPDTYLNIGHAFQSKGQVDEAMNHYEKALSLDPHCVDAYNNLGTFFLIKGQYDEAMPYFQKAIQTAPNYAEAYYNLGRISQAKGQFDEAIAFYERALQLKPNLTDAHKNMGTILKERGQFDEAMLYCQNALKFNPNLPEMYNNIGTILEYKKQIHEALSCFQKAIQLNPDFSEAYSNMGNVYIVQGKINEGMSCFKKALKLNPASPKILFNLAGNKALSYDDSKELLELAKELIKHGMSEKDSIDVYFAMGKLSDNLQMFEQAFEYYRLGNTLKRARVEFNIDHHIDYFSRIKKTFSADFMERVKPWGNESVMPVFIFGMPRSGTTLAEQILASHPDVYGGGELQFFNQIDQKLASILKVHEPYPECLNFLDNQTAYDIAESYREEIRKLAGSSKTYTRITDKNPFNFYHLGLISLLFPKARFIHCQRHPLDTCVSIYFQHFSQGNYFAYDLGELGQYYREYLKLMNHWRKVLPIKIFELKYEDIVQKQEEVTRKMIDFCGLDWDPACLDFYKKDRPVFTASNWQVRQPIYTTSCGRWRNYDQFLVPLKELLADFL